MNNALEEIYWEEQAPLCEREEDRVEYDFSGAEVVRFFVWASEKNPLYSPQPYNPEEEKQWQAFLSDILLQLADNASELFQLPMVRRHDIARLRVPMSRERLMFTMNEIKRYPEALFLIPRSQGHKELPQDIKKAVYSARINMKKLLGFCKYIAILHTDRRMIEVFTTENFLNNARFLIENVTNNMGIDLKNKVPRKIFLEGFVPIEPEQYYHFRLAGLTETSIRHKLWVDLLSEKQSPNDDLVNHLIESRWVSFASKIIENLSDGGRGLCCLSFPPPSTWDKKSQHQNASGDWSFQDEKPPLLMVPSLASPSIKRSLLTGGKFTKANPEPQNACPDPSELKSKIEQYCHYHFEDYYFVLQTPCSIGAAEQMRSLVNYGRLDLHEALGRCEYIIAHGIEEPLLEIFSDKLSLDILESAAGAAAKDVGAELVNIKPV